MLWRFFPKYIITKDNLIKAVNFGNRVSSIAVQRAGAQPSIPYLKEVIKIYGGISE